MRKCFPLLMVDLSLVLSASSAEAAEVANVFDMDGGTNTYQGGLGDGNWVEGGGLLGSPNAGSQLFASANGNDFLNFPGLGLTKVLGGTIENRTYEVSFFIMKYGTLSGVEFADFSTLRIGGTGGNMSWSSTATPIAATVWVKWVGTYTPSAFDIGAPFQFTAVFDLDAQHSIGIDGPVVAALSGQTVAVDIKPGSDPNSINPNSNGKIPVAILSTPDFDATTEVDKDSLTFGRTGDEESLARCTKSDEDVNGDGLDDVVCHFNTQDTGFQQGDTEGILRGQTVDGVPIEGRDSVRIVG